MALTKVRGSGIDADGQEIILDADTDTTITADTDDQIDFKTGGTDRLTINSSGNVGIGTSSPISALDLSGGADGTPQTITFAQGNDPAKASAIVGVYDDTNSQGIKFLTNSFGQSEAMRILSSGKLLVGQTTTSGVGGVSINPNLDDGACRIIFDRNATSATSLVLEFENGDSRVGDISYNSSSTTYATSSDYRLKENVVTDFDATSRLKQLKPSRFNFKVDKDKTVDGFLAHEVSSIVPEAVRGEKDAVDEDGNPEYQGIDQSKLVPLLTKALQEAVAKIEILEAKVTALENA